LERTSELSAEAREARREYYRQYRAAHKDKVRIINARFWANRAKKMKAEVKGQVGD
jgi:hypothetical protein